MHFTNGPQMEETVVRQQGHNLAVFALIEASSSIDIAYNCHQQQWDAFTTEKSALNVLVSTTTLFLYNPWSMEYACRDSID